MKKTLIILCLTTLSTTISTFGMVVSIFYVKDNTYHHNQKGGPTITACVNIDNLWNKEYGKNKNYHLKLEKHLKDNKLYGIAKPEVDAFTVWPELDEKNPAVSWSCGWQESEEWPTDPELSPLAVILITLLNRYAKNIVNRYAKNIEKECEDEEFHVWDDIEIEI